MKKWIIFFVFLFCINNVYSQTWERAFGFIPGKEEGANTICKLSDGNFVVSGFGEDEIPSTAKAIKININGDSIWAKKYLISGASNCSVYTSLSLDDGGFLMGGNCSLNNDYSNHTAFLGKFDTNGNIVWIKTYLNAGIQYDFNEILKANDGGFIAKGIDYILKV
ncbi:MAG TPA: hypothetical protein VN514_07410, partial [Ignavibacteria bacterium]|nr:hypothetical protein [Ignavibacteria bacterium]